MISLESYITIKDSASFEYEDRKSVFIGEAAPVSTEKDAIAFIESAKKRYPDARHHVYAYVLRDNSIMRFSDDHEPQGTAGMPVLDVIRKNGCTDTVIVVTRYFGGTLLGTGGLVKAYTSAAAGALTAGQIIRYDVYAEVEFSVSYSDYGKVLAPLSEIGFRVLGTSYDAGVNLNGKILKSSLPELEKKLTDITSGKCSVKFIIEKFDF